MAEDRLTGLINKLTDAETIDDAWYMMDAGVVNFTRSIVDEFAEANAKLQYEAGLKPRIVRRMVGETCAWCRALVGDYEYPNVPQEVFQRHENCDCIVEYIQGRKIQNVWSKTVIEMDEPQPSLVDEIEVAGIKEATQKLKAVLPEDLYDELMEMLSKNPDIRDLYIDFADSLTNLVKQSSGGAYSPYNKSIKFSLSNDKLEASKWSTLTHEYGHFFDTLEYYNLTYTEIEAIRDRLQWSGRLIKRVASSSDEYLSALRRDKEYVKNNFTLEQVKELKESRFTPGIQDALDGLWGYQDEYIVRWGHGNKYYNRNYNSIKQFKEQGELQEVYKELGFDASNQTKVKNITRNYETASELWANQMAALSCGVPEEIEAMKKWFPNTFELLERILKER